MQIEKLETSKFIELYELENGKYRTPYTLALYKIINKNKWFTKTKNNLSLTNEAWDYFKSKGFSFNKEEVSFDLLTQEEMNNKIKSCENIINEYQNKLNSLEIVNNQ